MRLYDGEEYSIDGVLNYGECPCGHTEDLEWHETDDGGFCSVCPGCDREFCTSSSTVTVYVTEPEKDPDEGENNNG